MKNNNFMPVKDFAKINEISIQAVYQAIKRGSLEEKKIGTYTLVRRP